MFTKLGSILSRQRHTWSVLPLDLQHNNKVILFIYFNLYYFTENVHFLSFSCHPSLADSTVPSVVTNLSVPLSRASSVIVFGWLIC